MRRLPIPINAYEAKDYTLSGLVYTFTFRYNDRNERWKVDIKGGDGVVVVNGLTLIEGTAPTVHLRSINFPNGHLALIQLEEDDDKATRNNIGINKSYELNYITNEEIEELLV